MLALNIGCFRNSATIFKINIIKSCNLNFLKLFVTVSKFSQNFIKMTILESIVMIVYVICQLIFLGVRK